MTASRWESYCSKVIELNTVALTVTRVAIQNQRNRGHGEKSILPHCHVTGDYMRYACACTGHLLRCCRVVRSPSSKSLPILTFFAITSLIPFIAEASFASIGLLFAMKPKYSSNSARKSSLSSRQKLRPRAARSGVLQNLT